MQETGASLIAKKSRARNTLLNTTAGMSAKIINILTGFIMRSVFIKTLGVEYAGVSSLFTDVLTVLSLAELGVSSAITYAMYKPVAQADTARINSLIRFYRNAYRIVAGTVLTVGLALIPLLGVMVPAEKISDTIRGDEIIDKLVLIYVLYVVNSAVSYLMIYRSSILTAHQENRYISIVQMVISISRVSVECVILFVFKNYIAYLIFAILITWTQNLLISLLAGKKHPEIDERKGKPLTREEKKKIFSDIGALMMYKISTAITNGCDSVIISSILGSTLVGFVGNYTMITQKVNTVVNQFFSSAVPSIGNLAAESDGDHQHKTFTILQFISFWLGCFCTTCFVTLMNPFVRLWLGGEYVMPIGLAMTLSAYFYLTSMIHPINSFRTSNGLFVQGKFRPVIMVIINIALSIALALAWGKEDAVKGVIGVKLATIIAQLVTIQWFDPWLVYKNVFKKPLRSYFISFGTYTAFTAAVCAGCYGLCSLINTGSSLITFILRAMVCVIIPNAAIILVFRKTPQYEGFMVFLRAMVMRRSAKKAEAE